MKKIFFITLFFTQIIISSSENRISLKVDWELEDREMMRPSDAEVGSTENLLRLIAELLDWRADSQDYFKVVSNNTADEKCLNIVLRAKIDGSPINISYSVKNLAGDPNFEKKSIWDYPPDESFQTCHPLTREQIKQIFIKRLSEPTTSPEKKHFYLLWKILEAQRSTVAVFSPIIHPRIQQKMQDNPTMKFRQERRPREEFKDESDQESPMQSFNHLETFPFSTSPFSDLSGARSPSIDHPYQ